MLNKQLSPSRRPPLPPPPAVVHPAPNPAPSNAGPPIVTFPDHPYVRKVVVSPFSRHSSYFLTTLTISSDTRYRPDKDERGVRYVTLYAGARD